MEIRLLEKIYFAKDLLYLVFDKEGLSFSAGHALALERDGIKRFYSAASAPSDEVLTFLVRLVPGGKMSTIFDRASPGEVWTVTGEVGSFSLEPFEGKVAVLSAGTGIAPFRSLYREALARDMDLDVVHIHSARYAYEIPFWGEWERYGVRFIPTVTRDPHFEGEKGRINADKVKELIPDYRERFFFACGSRGFIATAVSIFRELGIKQFRVEGW